MSRICAVCDKKPVTANNVSHAKNRTGRWLYPNVHKIRFVLVNDPKGKVKHACVCTKCVKAGKVKKVL